MSILEEFQFNRTIGKKSLALLLDPDKTDLKQLDGISQDKLDKSFDYIFVGGSSVDKGQTQKLIRALKKISKLPIVIFPGDPEQIDKNADALLFLNLISGRNPEFLIEKQIQAAQQVKNLDLEIISTSYILIDGGNITSTMRVSKTFGINPSKGNLIENTALAGQYMGHQCCYLEAGSGAVNHVSSALISRLKETLDIPLIVGGGIRSLDTLSQIFDAGADIAVIGNHIEKHPEFINEISLWNP